jgi:hypothetical protein
MFNSKGNMVIFKGVVNLYLGLTTNVTLTLKKTSHITITKNLTLQVKINVLNIISISTYFVNWQLTLIYLFEICNLIHICKSNFLFLF